MAAVVPDDPRPWDEIPIVVLSSAALGVMVLWLAIRHMTKKK